MSRNPATSPLTRTRLVAGLAVSLLIGCTTAPTTSPTATPNPTPTTTATAQSTPMPTPTFTATATATPSASAEPTDALGPYVCGTTISLPAVGTGQAATTDVRTGLHPGYDRLVFEYAGGRRPQLTITVVAPPFSLDPSGLPLTVQGTQFVRIRLDGIVVGYTGATSFKPGGPFITDVKRQGEYEGQQSWIVGLAAGVCPRVLGLTGPSRWVVDFGRP